MISLLGRAALVALTLAAGCSNGNGGPARLPSSESWRRGAELPTPRTEVTVAAIEDKIFVAGGFTSDGRDSRVVEMYDTRADSWSTSVSLPVPLHHTALAGIGARLYLVGGYTADGSASAKVWTWTIGDDHWRSEPDMPTARGALAVAAYEAPGALRIHAVGGATRFGGAGRLTGAHEVYDPVKLRWSTLDPLPAPRDHLAAAAIGEDVFVIGGRELSAARNQAGLDIFDTGSQQWHRGFDMPTARGGLAAASAGGRLFVFGGEEPDGTFEEAEVYDPRSDRWSASDPLPTARHGLGAVTVGDRVYVVGGGPTPGLSVSGANEILAVETR